jgi:hypothetical protein
MHKCGLLAFKSRLLAIGGYLAAANVLRGFEDLYWVVGKQQQQQQGVAERAREH